MSKRILYVFTKYSTCDLICDVISRNVWNCNMGKINVYDKIMIENEKKRKYGNPTNFYISLQVGHAENI